MKIRIPPGPSIFRPCLFLVCLLLATGCNKKEPAETGSERLNEATSLTSVYKTETEFILSSILTRFSSLCYQATGNSKPAQCKFVIKEQEGSDITRPSLQVKFTPHGQKKSIEEQVVINKPVWDPANYQSLFSKIFQSYTIQVSAKAMPTNEFLRHVLDFNGRSLQVENVRIGAELASNFHSVQLHREAAVLIGTLALKDFAVQFFDIRSELSELAARIAFANHLEQTPNSGNPLNELAYSLLYAGMNHQVGALEHIKNLPESEPLLQWKRGLHARVTGDYRPLQQMNRTVMEDVMFLHAYSEFAAIDQVWPRITKGRLNQHPDYWRIAHRFGTSVGLGHELMEGALAVHKIEEQEVKSGFQTAISDFEQLLPDFGSESVAGKMLEPISPGLWSYFLNRQLCHTIYKIWNFQERSWSVPEEAKEYRETLQNKFGNLRLYPYVARITCRNAEDYQRAMKSALPAFFKIPATFLLRSETCSTQFPSLFPRIAHPFNWIGLYGADCLQEQPTAPARWNKFTLTQ